ncbi:hypothetical protein [Frisingicoccus sp.]|uniref:hypothetical protein n=1 Tax=Frisingicoccus sp. TaxID=1918627 RepID=UPI002A81A13D|nr:hypothetical protein [Frisingicoccus sp.]MDY4921738.1 hypothetical protein [Frisingicoccus sp.]
MLLHARLFKNIAPEDKENLENLVGISALKKKKNATGFVGTLSCRVILGAISE